MMPPDIPLLLSPFYFLRHGETEPNRLGLVTGAADIELNATGRLQALAAAERLKGRGVTAIYSSSLRRARDTANCAAAALGLPVTAIPELAERNWGELEGRPRGLRVREATPPGGEGPDAFRARTLAGLGKIPEGGLPLVVAHSGTFRVLCWRLGIAQSETPVANSQPLRFTPPSGTGSSWTIVPL
ncbi:MAG: histidine phosphatase family protein [Burkholderiales bacterium]|nr:histidine phosphatase family protein [Burkholderiales bacterium]